MAIPLMIIYAILIAIATFVENDYGTIAAKALVYDTLFFNLLHIWLIVCLVGVILKNKLLQRKKYASLILHSSFIVIIFGAGITRFFGVEGTMNIREGNSASSYVSQENYINIAVNDSFTTSIQTNINYVTNKKLIKKIRFSENDFFTLKVEDIQKLNKIKNDNTSSMALVIEYKNKKYPINIIGGNGIGENSTIKMQDLEVKINWGAKQIPLPFSIKLNDFILERYPGSNSPSSFESKVTLIDEEKGVNKDVRIYMNNTLDYRGYRFFQAFYDNDELGTILSVNNDPGKFPTYIGYFLLILGAIGIIFSKNSRFAKLGKYLKSQSIYSVFFLLIINSSLIFAKDSNTSIESRIESNAILKNIELLKNNTKAHAKDFASLQVQSFDGRIKPIDTLANEIVHKITKKNNFLGLSNVQILIGMTIYPDEWKNIKMIKISTPQLKKIIGVKKEEKYIAFSDLIDAEEYKLTNYIEEAVRKNPAKRSKLDKDIIDVDERANIMINVFAGNYLRIFPFNPYGFDKSKEKPELAPMMKDVLDGNYWLPPIGMIEFSPLEVSENIRLLMSNYFDGIKKGISENNWEDASNALKEIKNYQKNSTLLIDENKVKTEIFLNNTNVFNLLILPYIALGLIMFALVFSYVVLENHKIKKALKGIYYLIALVVLLHFIGLILRWYIGGHAPWSNGYESMLYISFIAALSGVIFLSKSYLAISSSSFLAGISLFVANLGFMDPQIGNLVPVLKSYWLNIHVSIITASYGFLGLCFMLGLVSLTLFILRSKKASKLDSIINSIVVINEMSMIFGLMLLTVGNFLGGIWANESWGRYWGWDPKETWALVSIGIYAIILHLRFIVKQNFQYVFSVASVIGFFSILMTYFGVNYYLSGLHSYAAGDPLPIPVFLYYMVGGIILLIVLSYTKRQMSKLSI